MVRTDVAFNTTFLLVDHNDTLFKFREIIPYVAFDLIFICYQKSFFNIKLLIKFQWKFGFNIFDEIPVLSYIFYWLFVISE